MPDMQNTSPAVVSSRFARTCGAALPPKKRPRWYRGDDCNVAGHDGGYIPDAVRFKFGRCGALDWLLFQPWFIHAMTHSGREA